MDALRGDLWRLFPVDAGSDSRSWVDERFDGVVCTPLARMSCTFRFEGVLPFDDVERRSKSPRTCPSFWGVGPMEVRCVVGDRYVDVGGSYVAIMES